MKKFALVLLLVTFVATPAVAAEMKKSVGVSYGLDQEGVFGVHGEFDVSSHFKNAPVSAQVFWKNYSESFNVPGTGTYQYSYNGFGAAAIYNFGSVVKQNNKIKPYAGLGLIILNNTLSGPAVAFNNSADSSGLYVTFGARYEASPEISADLSYNNIGGLTIGANFHF